MAVIGFDSIVLNRPIVEMPTVPEGISPSVFKPTEVGSRGYELVFKAMVGASIRIEDEDKFRFNYEKALSNALTKFRIPQKKVIYKAAHLAKQSLHNVPDVASDILGQLGPTIDRIDIYCAYYNQPYVSVFGEAAGQRLLPIVFIERNQNAFPHVCAWKYLMQYPQDAHPVFQLDHFTSKVTPAWRVLEKSDAKLQVFFSGGECNPLIAASDLVLRLIELFQHGTVDGRSLLSPIEDHVQPLRDKLRFHNLGGRGEDQHHTAPVVNLDVDLTNYVKKPTYYIVWNPRGDRTTLKPAFEWGAFYNAIIAEAARTKGCVKHFDPEVDALRWSPSQDFVSPFSKEDRAYLNQIKNLGHDIPAIFRPRVT